MEDFHLFVNNAMNTNMPDSILLNGFTTFLMRDPEKRQNIYKYRMQWCVENYTDYSNIDKRPYYEYYQNNIQDMYPALYNPPPCFYNEMLREERKQHEMQQQELDEYYNDDIAMHYREIANRHLRRSEMLKEDSECEFEYEDESEDEEKSEKSYISDCEDYDYNEEDDYYDEYMTDTYEDDYDY